MNLFSFTFPGGRLIDNFATLGAVATVSFTVPAGKRWLVFGGSAERDGAATFRLQFTNSADKTMQSAPLLTAGTTLYVWGALISETMFETGINEKQFTPYKMSFPFPLKAGDKIVYTWSVAQTSPEVTCVVLEIDD